MNIVALLGSPRKDGNSTAMAEAFMEQAAQLGAQTQAFHLNQLAYKGCQGCMVCKTKLEHCVLKDGLTPVLEALAQADIWVVASPIYFGQISGQLKCCLDRWFSFLKPDYTTNPQPCRLAPGKKGVWFLSQAGPEESFGDVFPLYTGFLKWYGFVDNRLVRATNTGQGGACDVNPAHLAEAKSLARQLLA
jgi:multimeric flavodoxin WrbA